MIAHESHRRPHRSRRTESSKLIPVNALTAKLKRTRLPGSDGNPYIHSVTLDRAE